jgi:acetyl esterase/lipase
MFSKGAQISEARLEKHVPAGIVTRRDIAYGGTRDETFDLYYQEGTNAPRPTIVWVHGGGFIGGSKSGIANYMKVLAGHGYTMIAVEYSKVRSHRNSEASESASRPFSFRPTAFRHFRMNTSSTWTTRLGGTR